MSVQEVPLQAKPKKEERIIFSQEEGGIWTLLNPTTGKTFIVNKVGKRVLELCNSERTIEEIVAIIAREFPGAQQQQILTDIVTFLRCAEEEGVLQWS